MIEGMPAFSSSSISKGRSALDHDIPGKLAWLQCRPTRFKSEEDNASINRDISFLLHYH